MLVRFHSNYSMLWGTMSVEDICTSAQQHGITSVMLTDINTTAGIMPLYLKLKSAGINLVAGAEIRSESNSLQYILVAQNNEGFAELNRFLTEINLGERTNFPDKVSLPNVISLYPSPSGANDIFSFNICSNSTGTISLPAVSYLVESDRILHKVLCAIDNNCLLAHLQQNMCADEAANLNAVIERMKVQKLAGKNYHALLQAKLNLNVSSPKNKQLFSETAQDDITLLTQLAQKGLDVRYPNQLDIAQAQMHKELRLIFELGFCAYFLITWDLIMYAKSKGFYHVGRGSGANSLVAYCLGITDVDPLELDLYFERFINPKRTSPPDFDIDFSWKDREQVQAYLFKKYGSDKVALLGATNTFQDRAILRELGKVFGLSKQEIDSIVHHPENKGGQDSVYSQIFDLGARLVDFPHHRSIHAGGVLVSEEPLYNYTALFLPPKGFPTTEWDMHVAEAIGYEKIDVLSQRGIGHINDCVALIKKNKGAKVNIHDIASIKQDARVNEQLYKGEATGCFYIESPAMRGLLKKLRCNDYLRLIAASSIIRPGVAKSGMMKEYIRRFHNPDKVQYLHPVFEEQLSETYGVMVYQEDVIKICHHFAGLDLADADILRRAMSGKYRSKKEFERIKNTFFSNCRTKGYPGPLIEEVWRQISSFAGYAFSKAHSASYAVESYQSLYLKTYYPQEFAVAVINNFGGFYSTWVYVNEGKRAGADICVPDINIGEFETSLHGNSLVLGFNLVHGLRSETIQILLNEREQNGLYHSLENFIKRTSISTDQVQLLIKLGAFNHINSNKKSLYWQLYNLGNVKNQKQQVQLFDEPEAEQNFTLPQLHIDELENAYDELELLGFPVCMSRFDMLQTKYRSQILAKDLDCNVGRTVKMLGEFVTAKNVHTTQRKWMKFGCFIDQEGQFFDTVHFPEALSAFPFTGQGIYLILGKVVSEFGFPSIEVQKMAKLPARNDPRYVN